MLDELSRIARRVIALLATHAERGSVPHSGVLEHGVPTCAIAGSGAQRPPAMEVSQVSPAPQAMVIDTTPPETRIVGGPPSPSNLHDATFTVQGTDLPKTLDVLKNASKTIGYFNVTSSTDVAKISVIGVGMRSHAGIAHQMFATLAAKGINIHAIATSEIKVSVLIGEEYTELALRALHTAYGLDKD